MFFQHLLTFLIFSLIVYLLYKVYTKYLTEDIISEDESLQEIHKRTEEKERRLNKLDIESNCLDKEIKVTKDLKKVSVDTSRKHEKLEELEKEKM